MIIPDVLALDFDGVLCDGMREYFETSRRTYAKAWPEEPAPGEELLPAFRRLRPVILSGWEMPLLVRAIILERPEAAILADWAAVRDEVAASSPRHGDALIEFLKTALDQVRRDWIAGDRRGWLGSERPVLRARRGAPPRGRARARGGGDHQGRRVHAPGPR